MEYKPVQKKNSSWTPTTVQKKGKSSAQQGRFSIQPKTNPSSAPSQEIGDYSRASADRLAANAMRGIQAKELELAEGSTVQRQSESVGLSSGFDVAPPTTVPPTPKMGTGFPSVSETQIQRQCADCAFEQQEQAGEAGKDLKEIGIQTKLTIGAPGDPYEQEADQVAAQVMSMPAPPDSSASVQRRLDANNPHQIWQRAQSIKPVVQRRIDEQVQMRELVQRAVQMGGNQASGDLESRLNASKGGGSPLSEGVRGFMEPRFGADFSSVRVHTGGEAVQMNQELGAQAFTHGSDVYFGEGKSPGNNELTAHELTHVVQQKSDIKRSTLVQKFSSLIQRDIEGTAKIKGQFKVFTPAIKDSVGEEGKNNHEDVLVVQQLLIDSGYSTLKVTGVIDEATIEAIRDFQKEKFPKWKNHDCKIDVGKSTWKALTESYFNPDSENRERKEFKKKRSVLITPVDITSAVKGTLAFVQDNDKDGLDDAIGWNRQAANKAPGVDNIKAQNIHHVAAILQQYYDMEISIDTLYIGSHGSYRRQAFMVGNETITYDKISRLKILKDLLAPSTKLVVLACHVGGGSNPGKAKLYASKLAQTLGITVYTSRSWSVGSKNLFNRSSSYFETPSKFDKKDMKNRPNVYKFLGQWLETTPGEKKAKNKVVNSLKLNPDGTFEIYKSRFSTFSSLEKLLYESLIKNIESKK